MDIYKGKKFIKKKTKGEYTYLDTVIDSTTGGNDKEMVLYKSSLGFLYVREKKEFFEKFIQKDIWDGLEKDENGDLKGYKFNEIFGHGHLFYWGDKLFISDQIQ